MQNSEIREEYIGYLDSLINIVFFIFTAAPAARGRSQAGSRIGVAAVSLGHNHSNTRSQAHLRPPLPLMATPDP